MLIIIITIIIIIVIDVIYDWENDFINKCQMCDERINQKNTLGALKVCKVILQNK